MRWFFSFVVSYKPVTIFLDFVRVVAAAGWKKRRTEAALVFLSARHLRRNSVTHLKPSK